MSRSRPRALRLGDRLEAVPPSLHDRPVEARPGDRRVRGLDRAARRAPARSARDRFLLLGFNDLAPRTRPRALHPHLPALPRLEVAVLGEPPGGQISAEFLP